MKKARLAIILLLGILLVSGLACGSDEWRLLTYTEGEGTISPSTGTFPDGEIVTLTALPESGWDFDHWGVQASGSENPITISMDSDKTISAYFVEKQKVVLYSDDFSDPSSGWATSSTNVGSAFYQGGWLHIKNNRYTEIYKYSYTNQYFTDFIVEVEMKLVDGNDANWQNVDCRVDSGSGYSFSIGADGTYSVAKYIDFSFDTYLIKPTHSIHIHKGKSVTNLVHIECIGSTLSFSVNGHLLRQFTDYDYTGGDIQLGADSVSWSEFTEVAFDNIIVTAP